MGWSAYVVVCVVGLLLMTIILSLFFVAIRLNQVFVSEFSGKKFDVEAQRRRIPVQRRATNRASAAGDRSCECWEYVNEMSKRKTQKLAKPLGRNIIFEKAPMPFKLKVN